MKRKANILCTIWAGLMLLAACETEREGNPTYHEAESFTLDDVENKLYDMSANDTVKLALVQPDYGFTPGMTYSVQVSLEETFTDATEETEANYVTLGTTYSASPAALKPDELNEALVELYQNANPDEDYIGKTISAYLRMTAEITGSGMGNSTSNVIKLEQVKLAEVVITLEPPTEMYLIGSSIGEEGWKKWQKMVSVTQMTGEFWSMVWFDAGAVFKFGTMEGEYIGYSDPRVEFSDRAGAGIAEAASDGNIQVSKAGWYIVYIRGGVSASDYTFEVIFYEPEVYLIGNVAPKEGDWGYDDKWKFTVPADKSGSFVSPAFGAGGEVRMAVKAEAEWWRLEFTLKEGKIFYRENNNVYNGWTDLGPEYSISGSAGQTISLNFTEGTGKVQ